MRILIQSFGTWGDIYPLLVLAKALKQRGHQVSFATVPYYQKPIEEAGLGFYPIRPYINPADKQILKRSFHPIWGFPYLLKQLVFPAIEETFTDSLPLVAKADLLLTGSLSFSGPLLHQLTKTPWVRCVLQPSLFLSQRDPPALSLSPIEHWLKTRTNLYANMLLWLKKSSLSWAKPLLALERKHGFKRTEHPIFGAEGSRQTLGLFSKHFAPSQADWPNNTLVTGFLFDKEQELSKDLNAFLANNKAPLVFTLGSAAGLQDPSFFTESIKASKDLNRPAILIAGEQADHLQQLNSSEVQVIRRCSHRALFPQAAAVVHHAGIGTSASCLRTGKPMLLLPLSQDQPDNAKRIERLGLGLSLSKRYYKAPLVAKKLELLLRPSYQKQSLLFAKKIKQEQGLLKACQAIELSTVK